VSNLVGYAAPTEAYRWAIGDFGDRVDGLWSFEKAQGAGGGCGIEDGGICAMVGCRGWRQGWCLRDGVFGDVAFGKGEALHAARAEANAEAVDQIGKVVLAGRAVDQV
jgi:hypothetical protein